MVSISDFSRQPSFQNQQHLFSCALICLWKIWRRIWILIKSAIRLQYVFFLKDSGSEEWIKAMIVNILTLILGLVLVFNPFKGAEAIMRIIGIFMIIYAILDIFEYYMTKPKKVKVIK